MGFLADLKLLKQFKMFEKEFTNRPRTGKNPLVHTFGFEKTFGKHTQHDFKEFVRETLSWAFACAYKNAYSVASVPMRLYKRVIGEKGQSDLEEVTDHVFLDMMRSVNPYFNQFELKVITTLFLEITGNAYWWMIKNNLGVPEIIWNLPSHWTTIVPSATQFISGYVLTTPGKGTKTVFPADEVCHFKYPGMLDVHYGCPPMYGANQNVDLDRLFKKYAINFLNNFAQPSGVLTAEDALGKSLRERVMTMWKLKYQGTGNAGKIALLEGGLKYQKVGATIGEMNYDKIDEQIRDGILAVFGVPASKLGLTKNVNRANAEANDATYQKETIQPRLRLIEEKINERIMPLYDPALVVKFDNPVPEDKEFELKERTEHIKAGFSSIDEERVKANRDELNLPETAVPLIPFNVLPAGGGGEPTSTGPEGKMLEKSANSRRRRKWEVFAMLTAPQERALANTMERFFKSQREIIMSNLNKFRSYSKGKVKAGIGAEILFIVEEENERLKTVAKPHIEEAYKQGVALGYQELNATVDFDAIGINISRAVERRMQFFAEKVNGSTVDLISEALAESLEEGEAVSDVAQRLDKIFDFSENFRSTRVARTEIIGATNAGQLEGYVENDVEDKMWVTARDEKVRDSHQIDGQTVAITEDFTLGSGVRLQYPGDRTGSAPVGELVNCRCTVAPIVKKG